MTSLFLISPVRLICLFEVFATLFINLIYLSMLHLTAVESGLSFLAVTFFLLAAFFLFALISICQWTIDDPLVLLASKLFSYQIVQVFLFLFCTLCVVRLTIRQDAEGKKPLSSFLPYYIFTEPTSSSALPSRSHIALNLMRNPMNSFNKLQRQATNQERPPQYSLHVPRNQQYYSTDEQVEEGQVSTPREILTSRNAEESGFMTVAMLRRASQISQRFQNLTSRSDRSSAREETFTPRSSSSSGQPLDVSQLLGFFITTSSVAMTIPERNKRAVERIRQVLHQDFTE
uniref:Transmembrane protein n=1 Tax=Caenorhabditis tropicalis TaxID=1561998 RepID=A0A1I7V1M8_9PELO